MLLYSLSPPYSIQHTRVLLRLLLLLILNFFLFIENVVCAYERRRVPSSLYERRDRMNGSRWGHCTHTHPSSLRGWVAAASTWILSPIKRGFATGVFQPDPKGVL